MKLYSYFETKKRGDETITVLKDTRPDWLQEAIRAAHCGSLPNDWIYETAASVCEYLDENPSADDDDFHETCDSMVDIYTSSIYQWAADNQGTSWYDEAKEEAADMGGLDADAEKQFQTIQYCAIRNVFLRIASAREEEEEDDAESV